jgi:hypothetical protein
MLMGLKIRNGFGEKELTVALGTALHRGAAKHNCEECGVKVAGGASNNKLRGPRGASRGLRGPLGLAIPKLAWPPIYIES